MVMLADVPVDGGLKIDDALEDAALEPPPGQVWTERLAEAQAVHYAGRNPSAMTA